MREYIDQGFSAARILEYDAQEQELVDQVVMNLHPDVLAHSAFLDMPHSRKDLYDVIGLIEEKIAVNKERQRDSPGQVATSGGGSRVASRRIGMYRDVRIPPNVGRVVAWATCNVTVAEILLSRETGRCPEVPGPPGENINGISEGSRQHYQSFIVGHLVCQGKEHTSYRG